MTDCIKSHCRSLKTLLSDASTSVVFLRSAVALARSVIQLTEKKSSITSLLLSSSAQLSSLTQNSKSIVNS